MPGKKKNLKRRRVDLRATAEEGSQIREDLIRGYYKPLKKAVTLRLDADIVAWFKKQGSGYQTRINMLLRAYMNEHIR